MKTTYRTTWLLWLLALIPFSTSAKDEPESGYRKEESKVLVIAPDTAKDKRQLRTDFLTAYKQADKPKFLVLWQRTLSDQMSAVHERSITTQSTGASNEDNYQRQTRIEWKENLKGEVSLLPPAQAAGFEAGFISTLRSAGAKVVDRNTAIRLQALKQVAKGTAAKNLDAQLVEMEALSEFADYFISINFIDGLATDEAASPHIVIINSKTGEVIVDVIADEPSQPENTAPLGGTTRKWKVGKSGFVVDEQKPSLSLDGKNNAWAVIQHLYDYFSDKNKS